MRLRRTVACFGFVLEWVKNDPRKVVDEYKPSREQLTRSKSESQLWDDDGLVKNAEGTEEGEKGEAEDEDQLKAILKSHEMPQPEDGGVDDEELKMALQVPLPADVEVAQNGELEQATQVPLPVNGEGSKEGKEEI
jgi:hypothetical protein